MKYIIGIFVFGIIALALFILSVNFYVLQFSQDKIYTDIDNLSPVKVGLVFGASVYQDGTPSDVLRDRLDGSYEAYKAGKIQKLIVSGDNSVERYDEPTAMKQYLINKGIAIEDIFLDYAGFDTYDSLYRASYIFGVSDIVLFTQSFHLKRALYIADGLGIDAIGFATDYHRYVNQKYNNRREAFSRVKAFIEIEIINSKPKFLGEPILIP